MVLKASHGPHPRWRLLVLALVLALLCPDWRPAVAQSDPCPEPNDDLASACPIGNGETVHGSLQQAGGRAVYRVVANAAPSVVRIELSDLAADFDLYLVDPSNQLLRESVQEGSVPEQIEVAVQPGTYLVFVQADPGRELATKQPYTLRLTVTSTDASTTPALTVAASSAPATAPTSADGRRILLSESFDDPRRGLIQTRRDTHAENTYEGGEYRVRNISPEGGWRGLTVPGTFGNATLTVDARLIGDPRGRLIALGCRQHTDPQGGTQASQISFAVYPDARSFEIVHNHGRGFTTLVPRRTTSEIRPGNEVNHLELSCVGSTATVRANDVDLATASDIPDTPGRFFVAVSGPGDAQPHADASIDNLAVYGP